MKATSNADVAYLDLRSRAVRPEPSGDIVRWQRSLLAAAERALVLYPGPVGQLVARELYDALQFEFLGAVTGPTRRLVEYLLDQPSQPGSIPSDGLESGENRADAVA